MLIIEEAAWLTFSKAGKYTGLQYVGFPQLSTDTASQIYQGQFNGFANVCEAFGGKLRLSPFAEVGKWHRSDEIFRGVIALTVCAQLSGRLVVCRSSEVDRSCPRSMWSQGAAVRTRPTWNLHFHNVWPGKLWHSIPKTAVKISGFELVGCLEMFDDIWRWL